MNSHAAMDYLLVLGMSTGCRNAQQNKENYEKNAKKCKTSHVPVGLCPEDSHQTTEPAGRWGPDSSSLLWFSSWPSTLHSPAHTPLHRSLQTKQQYATQ